MDEVRLVLSEAERAASEFFELFYRHTAYDDWAQRQIEQRPWIDTTESEKRQDPETTKQ